MDALKRIELYLARAKEAEEEAFRSKDPGAKQAWEAIAAGYRELARRNGHR